jgi:hypothetical protein
MKRGDFESPFFVGILMIKLGVLKFCDVHFLSICLHLRNIQYNECQSSGMRVSKELKQIAKFLTIDYLCKMKIKSR